MADKPMIIIADAWEEEMDTPSEITNTADNPYFLGIEDLTGDMSEASSTGDGVMDRMQRLYEFVVGKKSAASEAGSELDLAGLGARSNGSWKL